MTRKAQKQRNLGAPRWRLKPKVVAEVQELAGIIATDRLLVHLVDKFGADAPSDRTLDDMVSWALALRGSPAWGVLQAEAAAGGVLSSDLDREHVGWIEHIRRVAPDFNDYLTAKLAREYLWREQHHFGTKDLDEMRDRAALRVRQPEDWLNALDAFGLQSPTQEAAERVRQLAERAKVVLELEAAGGRYAEVITGRVRVRMPSLQAEAIADQET